jgi:hypothetical protein
MMMDAHFSENRALIRPFVWESIAITVVVKHEGKDAHLQLIIASRLGFADYNSLSLLLTLYSGYGGFSRNRRPFIDFRRTKSLRGDM